MSAGVILQTFPPEDLQWYWKIIADLPPLQNLPPYHFNRYWFYLYILILIFVILWKNIRHLHSFIIKQHILHVQSFTIIQNPFFLHPKMRIRNFTKMGEGLQYCRSTPGEGLQWKGEICNVANLPPWGKVCNVADLSGGNDCNVAELPAGLQCCRPSGGKVCKGDGLQYNTGFPL